jgi:hypothetical protein
MSASWLSQLAPDRAPPPPPLWPPAPGWLALALLLALGGAFAWGWRRWRRQRGPSLRGWRRIALRELARLEAAAADDATLARRLQQLLRRYALARYGRAAVAGLSGEAWLAFVVAHGGADWAGAVGAALLRCAWGGAGAGAERERWLGGARAFIGFVPPRR